MPCSSLVVHVHIYHLNQEGRKSRVHKTIIWQQKYTTETEAVESNPEHSRAASYTSQIRGC